MNTTDFFATLMELHGISLAVAGEGNRQDTQSFLPCVQGGKREHPRTMAFSEIRSANAKMLSSAIRDERYKLIRRVSLPSKAKVAVEECYDLQADPLEQVDLFKEGRLTDEAVVAQVGSLRARMDELFLSASSGR